MNLKKYLLIIGVLIGLFHNELNAQTSDYTYYKIEISGERNQILNLMNDRYRKEVFVNKNGCFYVYKMQDRTEIIQYDADKMPVKFYVQKGDQLYLNETHTYMDSNSGELSDVEKQELTKYYTINRDITKVIRGVECFQVIMEDPSGGNTSIEMYVTESLPNLPNHFPLSTFVLDAEPLEVNMKIMGAATKVEIVEMATEIDIEAKLGFQFKNAVIIDNEEYLQMKDK